MASLSTSGVSQLAWDIFGLAGIVIGNFLDKVEYYTKVNSSILLPKAIVYYFELQIMQKKSVIGKTAMQPL